MRTKDRNEDPPNRPGVSRDANESGAPGDFGTALELTCRRIKDVVGYVCAFVIDEDVDVVFKL